MARAYAMALGDAEKTKALYIGMRAQRMEDEAVAASRREAQLQKDRAKQAKAQAKLQRTAKPSSQGIGQLAEPKTMDMSPEETARAVKAMREALAASGFKDP